MTRCLIPCYNCRKRYTSLGAGGLCILGKVLGPRIACGGAQYVTDVHSKLPWDGADAHTSFFLLLELPNYGILFKFS